MKWGESMSVSQSYGTGRSLFAAFLAAVSVVGLTLAQPQAARADSIYYEYTGTLDFSPGFPPDDVDLLGLDGATFVWTGTFDADQTPVFTNGGNLDRFAGDIELTLSGTAALDGTYSPNANTIAEVVGPSDQFQFSNVADFSINGYTLQVGAIAVPAGFTGAVSPDNTPSPFLATDVVGYTKWLVLARNPPRALNYNVVGGVASGTLVPEVDIELSSMESIDPVIAGSGTGNLVHTITATNLSGTNASGVEVSVNFTYPTGVTPDSVVASGAGSWSDTIPGTWTIGDLAAGASETLTLTFTAAASAAAGTDVIDTSASVSEVDPTDTDSTNDTTEVATSIAREVDIELTASDNPDPVVAGSGTGNLVHVLTVDNNGPSDASGVSVAVVPTLPAGVSVVSIVPSVGGYAPGTWTVGDLAAGASATLTITLTVALTAAEGTDVISAQGTATSNETDTVPANNVAVDPTSVRWPTATFRVAKEYTGGSGPAVEMELSCSDTSGLLIYDPQTGTALTSLTVRRFDIDPAGDGTSCTIIETVPNGYYELARTADCDVDPTADQGSYECTITNAETRVTVRVTKDFTDGDNPTEATVSLDCNTGLILDQDKDIIEGPANYVEFVVTSFTDGTLDCQVVEDSDSLPGYIASYEAGVIFQQDDDEVGYSVDDDGCHFTDIPGGAELSCAVTNDARPQPVVITKEWQFEGSVNPGDINLDYTLTLHCDGEVIEDGSDYCKVKGGEQVMGLNGDELYTCKRFYGNGDDDFTAMVVPTYPGNNCWVTEDVDADYVETDVSDCDNLSVSAVDGGDACTVTNLVFYEGIPSLSQYGMALMALLMLGMAGIGFRRFI